MSTANHVDISALAMATVPSGLNSETDAVNKGKPEKYEGYLMKKKKWPLKGWHKRYFFLDNGFLKYAKSPHAITKNKLHGLMDMGMSVMSTKKNGLTIDLDAEDTIFHLKSKSSNSFQVWVSKLRCHRDYRLHELKKDSTLTHQPHVAAGSDSLQSSASFPSGDDLLSKDQDRLFDSCNQDLNQAQREIVLLSKMVVDLQATTSSVIKSLHSATPPPPSPNFSKKERKSKKVSKKNSKSVTSVASVGSTLTSCPESLTTSTPTVVTSDGFKIPASVGSMSDLSRSNPDLTLLSAPASKTLNIDEEDWSKNKVKSSKSVHSTPTRSNASRSATFSESSSSLVSTVYGAVNELTDMQNRFITTASNVQKSLNLAVERVRHLEEMQQNQAKYLFLKNAVSQLTGENNELKLRLQKIHSDSSLSEPFTGTSNTLTKRRPTGPNKPAMNHMLSESQLSITETTSEMFYDAEEYLISDVDSSSDEESETFEDEVSSDADLSDGSESTSTQSCSLVPYEVEEVRTGISASTGRRSELPSHKLHTDLSLWNILKKNIGKDLSKVAMPVTLNEPLNALQLLCEELEYSNLLDRANNCDDAYEQMVYVAAFAISGYGSTNTRAGQKPFNPILGETYECIRDDKGFRFVAEQVSHHPPVSVCHCDGENFEFWQDSRFKSKFWGKSMEIFPSGSVHVRLKKYDREFHWKKVTSCVHNIMTGTRWIEHYGDMLITCGECTGKISFNKSGYWSSKNGEVSGSVIDANGEVHHKLHGNWFEGIQCDFGGKNRTIWRKNPMPSDYEKQYGFGLFAVELNEITSDIAAFLPKTDTRFRPDQRCLEEGDIAGAETEKTRVEQLQRDHKKQRDAQRVEYKPLFFTKINGRSDDEGWTFKGDYWKLRKDPGFKAFDKLPTLW